MESQDIQDVEPEPEDDIAPDAQEDGDALPSELSDLVTDPAHVVPDEVDQPPTPDESTDVG